MKGDKRKKKSWISVRLLTTPILLALPEADVICYSYFWPLGVLPVLLYHICGSTTPNVSFLTVWESSQKYYATFMGVLPQKLYSIQGVPKKSLPCFERP